MVYTKLVTPSKAGGYRFKDIARTETAVRVHYMLCNKLMPPVDKGTSQKDVAESLYNAFLFAYDYGHRDHPQIFKRNKEQQLFQTQAMDDTQRDYFRGVFDAFAKKYYTKNGNMREMFREEFSSAVETLNDLLAGENSPLANSTPIVGALLVEIGRSEKAKKLFPAGIDFSRAKPVPKEKGSDLNKRATEAISDKKTKKDIDIQWEHPTNSFVTIGGLRFLSRRRHGKPYLVTQSGMLVDEEECKEKVMDYLQGDKKNKKEEGDPDKVTLALPVNAGEPEQLSGYVKKRLSEIDVKDKSKVRRRQALGQLQSKLETISAASEIDGMKSEKCGTRLVCLDVDMLTGLRMDNGELAQFKDFLAKYNIAEIVDLIAEINPKDTKTPQFYKRMREDVQRTLRGLWEEAPTNIRLLIDKATPNLCLHLPRIYAMTDKAFVREDGQLKQPPSGRKPYAYFTQGGSASRKTGLHGFAKSEIGNDGKDLVIASLDDARSEADQYWLCLGAGHYGEDYKRIAQFGNAIRSLTAKRAREYGLDFLMDGTGIPFEGRYAKLVHDFKEKGYETTVLAAARHLYLSPEQHRQLTRQRQECREALERARYRGENTLREVIIPVIVNTHTKFPVAANDAKLNKDVDRHITFDTSLPGRMNQDKIIAYTQDIEESTLKKLQGKESKELRNALEKEKLVPDNISKMLPQKSNRLALFKVIRDDGSGHYRIEIITDAEKYKSPAMLEKGLLNTDVLDKGPEALFQHTLSFDMMGQFQKQDGALELHYEGPLRTQSLAHA